MLLHTQTHTHTLYRMWQQDKYALTVLEQISRPGRVSVVHVWGLITPVSNPVGASVSSALGRKVWKKKMSLFEAQSLRPLFQAWSLAMNAWLRITKKPGLPRFGHVFITRLECDTHFHHVWKRHWVVHRRLNPFWGIPWEIKVDELDAFYHLPQVTEVVRRSPLKVPRGHLIQMKVDETEFACGAWRPGFLPAVAVQRDKDRVNRKCTSPNQNKVPLPTNTCTWGVFSAAPQKTSISSTHLCFFSKAVIFVSMATTWDGKKKTFIYPVHLSILVQLIICLLGVFYVL